MLKIQPVPRSSLFFGQYQYCYSGYLYDLTCLRGVKDSRSVVAQLYAARQYRTWRSHNWGGSWAPNSTTVMPDVQETEKNLLIAFDTIQSFRDIKIVYCYDFAYIYNNDLTPILNSDLPRILSRVQIKSADLCIAPGTVPLKSSSYSLRTYLRNKMLTDNQIEILGNFITSQSDSRASPSLRETIWFKYRWLRSNYFIDHNSSTLPLMLELAVPGIIRKTLDIVIAK